jgi:hypothetical protein
MIIGMSPGMKLVVAGLAAVSTTTVLMTSLVGSFDPRLLQIEGKSAAAPAIIARSSVDGAPGRS